MSNRRKLVMALGAGVLMTPFGSFAQQPRKAWRIGVLSQSAQSAGVYFDPFKAGMRELGYAEGTDYVFENRFAELELARLPALAAELVALKVDLILAAGHPPAVAARDATREIPIVMWGGDPVANGLVASYSRPGGNVTGLSNLSQDVAKKQLDLLRQLVPGMRRVGDLYNPDNDSSVQTFARIESLCRELGLQHLGAPVTKRDEFVKAFDQLKRDKAQGVLVGYTSLFNSSAKIIVDEAAKHRLPAIYGPSRYVDAGGLISYAGDFAYLLRRAAAYVDRIFKGAKPADLPIEQVTQFDLVINLKTARALGLKIPQTILILATRVIE